MVNPVKSVSLFIIKAGLFIVPFIPLYVSRAMFFPYITGKAFVFRTIVEIIFAAWLFLAIFYKEYRPRKTSLLITVSIFISIVVLATIFSVNPTKAFWSNFERMEGFVAYLHLFAYFLVLGHVFQKKDWFIFFNLFVVSGLIENVYALFQKLGYFASPQGGFRVDGTIGNPTYLAAYLIFILAFCILLIFQTKNKFARYFYGFVGLFSLLTIYFTATRGVALALFIGALFAGVLYLALSQVDTERKKLFKKIIIVLLILVILAPVGLWVLKDTSFVKKSEILSRFASTFRELSGEDSGSQARFIIWNMAWQGVKERPLLGWGPEGFTVVFSKYYRPELYSKEPWFDRSHNIALDWLINAGILGLAAYFSILIAAAYLLWDNYFKKKFSLGITILFSTLLLAYLLQNFFVFDQLAAYISYFAILALIHNAVISGNGQEKLKSVGASPPNTKNAPIVVGILLILLIFIIYFVNVKPLSANLNLLNALKFQSQDFQKAFMHYEKALSYNTLGNQEIREQLTRFAINVGGLEQINPDFRDKILRRAITENQKGVEENKLDARPYLFLGTILGKVGLLDESINVFNKALELSPKKQQTYFEVADVYIKKEEYDKAVKVMETAYYFEPRYDEARINLIATYILNSQQDKADELLVKYYETVNVPDKILIQVYSRTKNYLRLLGIWQAMVAANPKELSYRKSLIGAHLLLNQNKEAIKVLEETIKLFPEFKQEGESYIEELRSGK
jgi:O-antigen ligase/Flp pilus assembly protein TadD